MPAVSAQAAFRPWLSVGKGRGVPGSLLVALDVEAP